MFHLVYRLQREDEDQKWLFVVALYQQVLEVLKGFEICASERTGWYMWLERKCVSPGSRMQFSGRELHVEWLIAQKKSQKKEAVLQLTFLFQPINCSAHKSAC